MSRGQHLATCICCGKRWIVGDCIMLVCSECMANGHTGMDCRKCQEERMSRMQVLKLAEQQQKGGDA